MRTINQTNNFQNSENELAQNFEGANIEKQENINNNILAPCKFPKLKLITKKYKNKKLNWLQFIFIFWFRFTLFSFLFMLLLLPFFSTNQDKISFWLFAGMIIVFVIIFNWLWVNKIYEKKD